MKKLKIAYTLAEIVIVLLIIAVIVSVSIKTTKTKLDSIVSLTYYSAFNTLKHVSDTMLKEYRDTEDYRANTTDIGDSSHETIPRSGEKFCAMFALFVNTKTVANEQDFICRGDSVTDTSNFNEKKPDLTLRNGMLLYNISKGPFEISDLNNNTGVDIKYNAADGREIDVNKWGYIVYIDLNGDKGNGELWDDVYKFYITMSGKVIPVYNAAGDGGNNRFHLQVSVIEEIEETWIKKSVSFKEGACSSGYVGSATPYCSAAPAVTKAVKCAAEDAVCKLKIIVPVRF